MSININKKHYFMVLTITMLMITGLLINNAFGITDDEAYAGNQLKILGILKGYEDGTLRLENNITREEVATMTVRLLGYEDIFVVGEMKVFTDIDSSRWSYEYVENAYKLGIIKGYPDDSFRPQNNITYSEVVAIMVNALDEDEDLEGDWPYNYLNKGLKLGIIDDISDESFDPNKIVTRGEMAQVVWNTLLVRR